MKHLKSLFVIISILMTVINLTSCKDDDKDEPVDPNDYEKNIVGTWTGNIDEGDFYTTCTLTFTSSGSFSIKMVDSDDGYTESGTGTYSLSGKKITVRINWDGSTTNHNTGYFDIISMSSKSMVLSSSILGGNLTLTR